MRARSNSEGAEATATPRVAAGEMLRDARVATGQSLEHVAAVLRIRLVYLRAIEDGRYEELPGAAYAAGFLRSFSEHVGLDPEGIVRLYKEEMSGRDTKQELYFPTPASEGRVPGGTLLFATLLLAGAVYGGWYYLSATDRSMVDVVPALPDRLVALVQGLPWRSGSDDGATAATTSAEPTNEAERASGSVPSPDAAEASPSVAATPAPVASPAPVATPSPVPPSAAAPVKFPAPVPVTAPTAASQAAPTAPATTPATRKVESPVAASPSAVSQTTTPSSPAPVSVAPAAAPVSVSEAPTEGDEEGDVQVPTPLTAEAGALASAETPELTAPAPELPEPTRVFGPQNEASRIQLRATQDSWVQVKDGGGDLLFTRVLKPGEVYRVPDRPGIRVRTGNAGGLIVVTDGVAGPPMGAVGQVLRDVPLDAPSLRPTNG